MEMRPSHVLCETLLYGQRKVSVMERGTHFRYPPFATKEPSMVSILEEYGLEGGRNRKRWRSVGWWDFSNQQEKADRNSKAGVQS